MAPSSPDASTEVIPLPARPFSPSPPRESNHTYSRPPSLLFGAPAPSLLFGAPAPALYTLAHTSAYSLEGLPGTPPYASLEALGDGSGQGYYRPDEYEGLPQEGSQATPIRPKHSRAQSDSSTSSASPPLGATSLLAALVGNADNDSARSLALYNNARDQSPYSSHSRGASSSTTELPGSPQSTYSRASENTASFFSSTRSQPRIHQPTVVRRPSGRKLGFLPAPAQLSPSSSASPLAFTPPKTGHHPRYSLPGRTADIAPKDKVARGQRGRKASESGSSRSWGTLGSLGDLVSSRGHAGPSSSHHKHREPLPTFDQAAPASQQTSDLPIRAVEMYAANTMSDPDRFDEESHSRQTAQIVEQPDPPVTPTRLYSPNIESRISRTAPQLGRIWSHAPQPVVAQSDEAKTAASTTSRTTVGESSRTPFASPSRSPPARRLLDSNAIPLGEHSRTPSEPESGPSVQDDTVTEANTVDQSYASSNSGDSLPTPYEPTNDTDLTSPSPPLADSETGQDLVSVAPESYADKVLFGPLAHELTSDPAAESAIEAAQHGGSQEEGTMHDSSDGGHPQSDGAATIAVDGGTAVSDSRVADEFPEVAAEDVQRRVDEEVSDRAIPAMGAASDEQRADPTREPSLRILAAQTSTPGTDPISANTDDCTASLNVGNSSSDSQQDIRLDGLDYAIADQADGVGILIEKASGQLDVLNLQEDATQEVPEKEETSSSDRPAAEMSAGNDTKGVEVGEQVREEIVDAAADDDFVELSLQDKVDVPAAHDSEDRGSWELSTSEGLLTYTAPYKIRKESRNQYSVHPVVRADEFPDSFVFCFSANINHSATLSSIPFRPGRIELNLAWVEPRNWTWVPGRRLIPDWDLQLVPKDPERVVKVQARDGLVRGVMIGVISRIPVVWRFAGWL